ncbi:hypothetical protein BDY24DRAFT_386988 [Mrakia frigida]|uniref:uncharacterized protein n=1 Tax=Mrakia frigida TaxID=29902 RepID=UPI003FCBF94E
MSSSSSTFKTIAVAGGLSSQGPISASLGGFIAKALVKEGANVVVLGRASAVESLAAKELIALGVTVKEVDYDSPSSLAAALEGVEVVVSTLAGPGFGAQVPLAEASKAAGVQLFVPSEFGNNTIGLPSTSPLYGKTALQTKLKELELPSLLLFPGPFADWMPVNISDNNNEIHIIGEGNADISFTSRPDVSSFLAHILTHLAPSQLLNTVVPIEAGRISFNALAQLLIAKNPSAKIVYESHESALARFASTGDFVAFLKVEWDQGRGVVAGKKEQLKNGLWPEWKPTDPREFL